jgi:hypothetical protein
MWLTQSLLLGVRVEVTPGGKVGLLVALVVVVAGVGFGGATVAFVVGVPNKLQVHGMVLGTFIMQTLVEAKLAVVWRYLKKILWV